MAASTDAVALGAELLDDIVVSEVDEAMVELAPTLSLGVELGATVEFD